MRNSPIPILLVLLVLRGHGRMQLPALNSLELEAFLDQAKTCIHAIDKINGFAHGGASFPDMKKMMEIVEKLPL